MRRRWRESKQEFEVTKHEKVRGKSLQAEHRIVGAGTLVMVILLMQMPASAMEMGGFDVLIGDEFSDGWWSETENSGESSAESDYGQKESSEGGGFTGEVPGSGSSAAESTGNHFSKADGFGEQEHSGSQGTGGTEGNTGFTQGEASTGNTGSGHGESSSGSTGRISNENHTARGSSETDRNAGTSGNTGTGNQTDAGTSRNTVEIYRPRENAASSNSQEDSVYTGDKTDNHIVETNSTNEETEAATHKNRKVHALTNTPHDLTSAAALQEKINARISEDKNREKMEAESNGMKDSEERSIEEELLQKVDSLTFFTKEGIPQTPEEASLVVHYFDKEIRFEEEKDLRLEFLSDCPAYPLSVRLNGAECEWTEDGNALFVSFSSDKSTLKAESLKIEAIFLYENGAPFPVIRCM